MKRSLMRSLALALALGSAGASARPVPEWMQRDIDRQYENDHLGLLGRAKRAIQGPKAVKRWASSYASTEWRRFPDDPQDPRNLSRWGRVKRAVVGDRVFGK